MTTEDKIAAAWCEALGEAWALAKGERLGELRAKRAKLLDDRGIHPYSEAWGAVHAYERILPWLTDLRDGKGEIEDCAPLTLRRLAQHQAEQDFADEITHHGMEAFS